MVEDENAVDDENKETKKIEVVAGDNYYRAFPLVERK